MFGNLGRLLIATIYIKANADIFLFIFFLTISCKKLICQGPQDEPNNGFSLFFFLHRLERKKKRTEWRNRDSVPKRSINIKYDPF